MKVVCGVIIPALEQNPSILTHPLCTETSISQNPIKLILWRKLNTILQEPGGILAAPRSAAADSQGEKGASYVISLEGNRGSNNMWR